MQPPLNGQILFFCHKGYQDDRYGQNVPGSGGSGQFQALPQSESSRESLQHRQWVTALRPLGTMATPAGGRDDAYGAGDVPRPGQTPWTRAIPPLNGPFMELFCQTKMGDVGLGTTITPEVSLSNRHMPGEDAAYAREVLAVSQQGIDQGPVTTSRRMDHHPGLLTTIDAHLRKESPRNILGYGLGGTGSHN